MAHMIDKTTGMNAIAYVGDAPWHKLGQKMQAGMSIADWRVAAGLDWEVIKAPVQFTIGDEIQTFSGQNVLHRSDTGAALSIVSDAYKPVQPAAVLDFFRELADIGGFTLETAGALARGRRIWALAKVDDGAPVVGHDVVKPYVLLATSYDGSLATTARFTTVRVVCQNTLSMSNRTAATDIDEVGSVGAAIKVRHDTVFDPAKVRQRLGIVRDQFERWIVEARILAERGMSNAQAETFLRELLPEPYQAPGRKLRTVEDTRGYKRIMELFHGAAIGADLTGGQTRWSMANAVSQYIDHERGWGDDTRMTSAWFGEGEATKNRAMQMLTAA